MDSLLNSDSSLDGSSDGINVCDKIVKPYMHEPEISSRSSSGSSTEEYDEAPRISRTEDMSW